MAPGIWWLMLSCERLSHARLAPGHITVHKTKKREQERSYSPVGMEDNEKSLLREPRCGGCAVAFRRGAKCSRARGDFYCVRGEMIYA